MSIQKLPLLVVAGPTASGKTDIALKLAKALKGEIISCDSVQVYEGCIIGSNALSEAELKSVPHHGIGIVPPTTVVNAGWFVRFTLGKIEEIRSRGRLPIICGGTTMWLSSLLSGLATLPQRNEELRKSFEAKTANELYEELKELDPKKAATLHPNDRLRVERAIEIISATPKSSEQHNAEIKYQGKSLLLFKAPERDALYETINERTKIMFKRGFIAEVDTLLKKHPPTAPAFSSIGYADIISWMNKGRRPEMIDTLIQDVAQGTRNYAKRQMTFFRNEPTKRQWIPCEEHFSTLNEAALITAVENTLIAISRNDLTEGVFYATI